MNKLFGKTTGTELRYGYVIGKLLSQGVKLRNLEFIQYHPTTMETSQKNDISTVAAILEHLNYRDNLFDENPNTFINRIYEWTLCFTSRVTVGVRVIMKLFECRWNNEK